MAKNEKGNPFGSGIEGLDLLLLAQSVIGLQQERLNEKMSCYGNIIELDMRMYELNLGNAKLIWIINAFNVCDLSFVEFCNTWDVAIGRYLCKRHYVEIKKNLWVTENIYLECKEDPFVNRFSLGWRHDDVLCSFKDE